MLKPSVEGRLSGVAEVCNCHAKDRSVSGERRKRRSDVNCAVILLHTAACPRVLSNFIRRL